MRRYTTIITALLLCYMLQPLQAQQPSGKDLPLSATAEASLLTCGPGNDFYTTYGHTAIRIVDTASGVDVVYNYGTFDFGTAHFYWKFARGMLDYCLSRTSFRAFMSTYEYEQRAVYEQPLMLSTQEVNNLYVMLEWNNQPENRFYRYDFFRDNCATRARDMIEAALDHRKIAYSPEVQNAPSYRSMVLQPLQRDLEWWQLGISILLGYRCDKQTTSREQMFLPLWMEQAMKEATAMGTDGKETQIVGTARQLRTDNREQLGRSFPPTVVFGLLLLVVVLLTIGEWRSERLTRVAKVADRVLFAVAGVAGLFLIFMWVGTDHWCTKMNPNILWASPLYIFFAIFHRNSPRWAVWLQLIMLIVAAVVAIAYGYPWATAIIVVTLAVRTAMLLKP